MSCLLHKQKREKDSNALPIPSQSSQLLAPRGLQELHVDLVLGHSDSHQVVLAEERSVGSVLVEQAGLSVGHSEGSSLQQLSLGVGVDGTTGRESLLGGHLEHSGELDGELAVLGLLGDTEGARQHHSVVHKHAVLVRDAVLQNHEVAHSALAEIVREGARGEADHEGGRGHRDIPRGGHRAEHQAESVDDLVLVEHGERRGRENAHVDLLGVEDRAAVLDGAR